MLIKSIIFASIGLCLSYYSYTIEQKLKKNSAYKPFCDISDQLSCSKPLLSPYSALFGINNSLLGICFYISIIALALLGMSTALFWATLMACIASILFAFILIVKVQAFCLICVSLYIINALLFFTSYYA